MEQKPFYCSIDFNFTFLALIMMMFGRSARFTIHYENDHYNLTLHGPIKD